MTCVSDSNTSRWDGVCDEHLEVWRDIYRTRRERRLVKFSLAATAVLEEIYHSYLQRGREGGDLQMFHEHVARQSENIGRIAAGSHVFEGFSGDISVDTVERAALLGGYYTKQYIRRFTPEPIVPAHERDAIILHQELTRLVANMRQLEFELRNLIDTAPNIGITARAAKRAFDYLCDIGYVSYQKYGKVMWIRLSPVHYSTFHFRG